MSWAQCPWPVGTKQLFPTAPYALLLGFSNPNKYAVWQSVKDLLWADLIKLEGILFLWQIWSEKTSRTHCFCEHVVLSTKPFSLLFRFPGIFYQPKPHQSLASKGPGERQHCGAHRAATCAGDVAGDPTGVEDLRSENGLVEVGSAMERCKMEFLRTQFVAVLAIVEVLGVSVWLISLAVDMTVAWNWCFSPKLLRLPGPFSAIWKLRGFTDPRTPPACLKKAPLGHACSWRVKTFFRFPRGISSFPALEVRKSANELHKAKIEGE